ncbi:MAG: redoxin domain-containing protein [Acidobacteriota bacterium]|nr:redoxin domain-containing protein [Acidobacteriota bacterium]
MMRFRTIFGCGVALMAGVLAASAGAQMRSTLPEIGQAAPALRLERVIGQQAPAELTWAGMRGDVVVIEFWATWCPPCVGSIPHLNSLEREFAGQPVRFLSISYEKPEVVEKFLATHPMRGWVGVDEKRETTDAFGVHFLPLTVVVDREGHIAALTQPMALKDTAVRAFLAGGHPSLPGPFGTAVAMVPGSEPEEPVARAAPLFYVDVRPDTTPVGGWSVDRTAGRMTAVGWPAKRLLALLLDMPEDRIVGDNLLPGGRYTVVANVPAGGASELQGEIEQALGLAWDVRLRQEKRKMDVYLLRASGGRKSKRHAGTAGSGTGRPESMATVTRMLEVALQRPVIDETHLQGTHAFPAALPIGNAAGVVRTADGSGLELKQARRKIEVLVIEKR